MNKTIHQISVFLENKQGRLNEILALISKENIRIVTSTVADTSEFGILRIITDNPQKACQALRENKISANLTDVFAIKIGVGANMLSDIIGYFTQAGISIEYMYCYATREEGMLILRVGNQDKEAALDIIRENKIVCVSEKDLQL